VKRVASSLAWNTPLFEIGEKALHFPTDVLGKTECAPILAHLHGSIAPHPIAPTRLSNHIGIAQEQIIKAAARRGRSDGLGETSGPSKF
jgi:hypothetical protein